MKKNYSIIFLLCAMLSLVMVGCETKEERQLREFQEQMDENFADMLGMEVDEFSALREEQQKSVVEASPFSTNNEKQSEEITVPEIVDLNLPITMQEITFDSLYKMRISQNGELQELVTEWGNSDWVTIDTNVRSFHMYSGNWIYNTIFYIKTDNSLWGRGSNKGGLLGDGTGVDRENPIKILDNVAWFGGGYDGTVGITYDAIYAIKTDGTLWRWGDGVSFSPVKIAENIVKCYSNYFYDYGDEKKKHLAQTSDGRLYNYVLKEYVDIVGLYTSVYYINGVYWIDSDNVFWGKYSNDDVVLISNDVSKVIPFNENTFFIKTDGSLWGYGKNTKGELGDSTKVPRSTPIKIADNVADVLSYAYLTSNGELWTWNEEIPTPEKRFDSVSSVGKAHNTSDYMYVAFKNNTAITFEFKDYSFYGGWWGNAVIGGKYVHTITDTKLPQTVSFPLD